MWCPSCQVQQTLGRKSDLLLVQVFDNTLVSRLSLTPIAQQVLYPRHPQEMGFYSNVLHNTRVQWMRREGGQGLKGEQVCCSEEKNEMRERRHDGGLKISLAHPEKKQLCVLLMICSSKTQ